MTKDYRIKVIVLIFVFVLSQTLFWDIITDRYGYEKIYSIFQIMFTACFTILSIIFTKDKEHFYNRWENNEIFRKCMDKIFHVSGEIIVWFMESALLIGGVVGNTDPKKECEISKSEARKQIEKYDNMPVEARTILPVGAMSLVMIVLVGFNIISEQIWSWVQEVLNTIVVLVGLYFVIINVKECECLQEASESLYIVNAERIENIGRVKERIILMRKFKCPEEEILKGLVNDLKLTVDEALHYMKEN